ncbi:diguanylate cyclase domain-containing protein [Duganella violaceipulchra]|uniref:Diguanylate cyclase n=1 Tax=Duganella violaceipulchra TaxID=2849652 RepID=A0AA41HBM7_9BURK|nr:diguanylate cyclase [Duganella violaceicalia]MBV6323150.1 diguanylate cyclase [Duganella violaceicalia]MCP2010064.1 diguanylate cyclase (GGDEF)-like protein [Duganella violaceicalia]
MRPLSGFFLSFKFKITALVIALVLAAGIGTGGISLLIAESELRQVIARQELSLLTSAAALIDSDLQDKRQLLRLLAEQFQAHELTLDQVQLELETHETLREEFFNVSAFDATGKLIASLRDRNAKRINISDRKYFQETLRLKEGVISAPFKSVLSGKPVFVLTQPLRDSSGKIVCVLLGAIDLLRPSFSAQIDSLRTSTEGYLFIVTDDGVIVHHPNKKLLLEKGDDGVGTVLEAALQDGEGWQDGILDDGVPVLLVHKHLREAPWTIALSYPVESAFAPMRSVRLRAFAGAAILTGLAGLFGWAVTKKLLRPLGRLHRHVEDISAGEASIEVFDVDRADEFGHLSRAFYALSQSRARAELELHRLATTDVLTGIGNRRMFDDFLPKALARAARAGQQVGLAFLDVDHFKEINDTLGHAAGDQVLVEFARRLVASVRTTDTVARLAGDEFVIVFEQLASNTEIDVLGRKIVEAMHEPFPCGATQRRVTASIGIALTTSPTVTVDEVMRAADQALYGVKAAGRNGFAVNQVGAERVLRVRQPGR